MNNEEFDYPMKLAERDALEFEINNRYADIRIIEAEYIKLDEEIENWEKEQAVLDQ
jgi:hypothetical protein